MLSSMKGVKMAGLKEKLADIIQKLRTTNIRSATRFRMMIVYVVSVGKL
jgi:vacuolar-type H+-ATPase subunit I/STV1